MLISQCVSSQQVTGLPNQPHQSATSLQLPDTLLKYLEGMYYYRVLGRVFEKKLSKLTCKFVGFFNLYRFFFFDSFTIKDVLANCSSLARVKIGEGNS